jgi:hypothetical protein
MVSQKYKVTLPADVYLRLKQEGKQVIVRVQPGPRARYFAVMVKDLKTYKQELLGRYMLNAKPSQNLRFRDGNRFNHDPENLFLEEK